MVFTPKYWSPAIRLQGRNAWVAGLPRKASSRAQAGAAAAARPAAEAKDGVPEIGVQSLGALHD